MSYGFVGVDSFTPNSPGWSSLGAVASWSPQGPTAFLFQFATPDGPRSLVLSFLSPTCCRVRFNPAVSASYAQDNSYAVVNTSLAPVTPKPTVSGTVLTIDTGAIQVQVNLAAFAISVYRGGQLIHADVPGRGIVYIPGQTVIASFKDYPANAVYVGFGEKAGNTLAKNNQTMTFFNYDNFTYGFSGNSTPGSPLNASIPVYCSVPLLIEVNPDPTGAGAGPAYGYGIFLDNPAQSYFNVGSSDYSNMFGMYYFGALYGELNYYIMVADDARGVVAQYTQLTGPAPMPPRYVFGYHQGCYGYYSRYKLAQAANAYRAAQIPCDGLHIDIDFQDNYRTFTSSAMKFPDAQEMFADLKTIGFKCSTNITSMITSNTLDENGATTTDYPARDSGLAKGVFVFDTRAGGGESPDLFQGTEDYGTDLGTNPFPYPPNVPANDPNATWLSGTGYYPNLGDPAARAWFGQQYQDLLGLGLSMVWQDMTCPAIAVADGGNTSSTFPLDLMMLSFGEYVPVATFHNAYGLLMSQSTYEGLALLRPAERNFIIARGGYAGVQRYAALWTGDSASSWDFLSINIPEVLNFGLSGIPITGCDIGGFATGPPGSGSVGAFTVSDGVGSGAITNYELFTRWMQLGSFLPWYRNHYDGYSKGFQEPYNYADPVPANCRKYIELRYRMMQVYYDAMYQATQTGLPIARALFLNFPADLQGYNYLNDQFFVGDNVLVAPIIAQHDTASPSTPPLRNVYLPGASGVEWYAYQDNIAPLLAPVAGGTLVTNYYAPLNLVPIYIRAGAILPMQELEQWVGQLPSNPLTFNIYPGPDSSYQLYQDDGISTAATTSQAYRLTTISHTGIAGGQSIRVLRTSDKYSPPATFYFVAILATVAPTAVTAAGLSLPSLGEDPAALASSSVNAYYYNPGLTTTFIKVFDTTADITIVATFP